MCLISVAISSEFEVSKFIQKTISNADFFLLHGKDYCVARITKPQFLLILKL